MSEIELAERLERLERDNRRLKRFGAAALVLAAALGLIAATRPVPDVIKAHKFEAVDNAGVIRATMEFKAGGPIISLNGERGTPRVALTVLDKIPASGIAIANNQGVVRESFSVLDDMPHIQLTDPEGFMMTLGSTQTETSATGESQQTSADSIIMFGNDKNHRVIWKAP